MSIFVLMDLIKIWNNLSKEDFLRIKKYLVRVGKSKNKKINTLADELHEQVFSELDCLDCANCCKSIPPIINETDVKKAARFLGIKPTDFKDRYLRIDEDLDMVMKKSPCPFLEDDHKCFIYEARPRACREYPHTGDFGFGKKFKLHQLNVHYCPAVYHIVDRMRSLSNGHIKAKP